MATPTFENAGTLTQQSSGSTVTPGLPASTADGDFLVEIATVNSNVTQTKTSGFTDILQENAASRPSLFAAYKRLTGSEAGPLSIGVGGSTPSSAALAIRLRNVRQDATPLGTPATRNDASSSTLAAHSISGLTLGDSLLHIVATSNQRTWPGHGGSWERIAPSSGATASYLHVFWLENLAATSVSLPTSSLSGLATQRQWLIPVRAGFDIPDAALGAIVEAGVAIDASELSQIESGLKARSLTPYIIRSGIAVPLA